MLQVQRVECLKLVFFSYVYEKEKKMLLKYFLLWQIISLYTKWKDDGDNSDDYGDDDDSDDSDDMIKNIADFCR